MLSPGVGWYYMTDNSIYWPKNNFFPSMVLFAFDALLIYEGLSSKKDDKSKLERTFNPFSQEDALVAAITLRLFLLIPGYYFIEYDNKVYKAGININF